MKPPKPHHVILTALWSGHQFETHFANILAYGNHYIMLRSRDRRGRRRAPIRFSVREYEGQIRQALEDAKPPEAELRHHLKAAMQAVEIVEQV